MAKADNILFIMCDQLRWDYLSCYGHPSLHTPHLDALAAWGVRFSRAYVQSPVCGPSRMSYYTGRYVQSHGSSWNFVPLKAGEMTIGDHLRPLGVQTVLVGKTHMRADIMGMLRMGIDPNSEVGVRLSECGFEPYERDDGLHPNSGHDPNPRYSDYLRAHGFDGENPWEEWVNSAEGENGELHSGWFLKNSNLPARIPAEHSETAYMTQRAMDFITEASEQPWCLHLSYINPHWPYMAPEPYATMYGPEDVVPVVRSEQERENPHPVYGAFMRHQMSKAFCQDQVRDIVIPAYMGLVKQVDDEIGRLLGFLEERGLRDNTMIIFCADHGDYLGDHWLGEKELFHEPSVRTPLIICDPDSAADGTRGRVCDQLVEAVDLTPTFLDVYGGYPQPHIFDGRSLLPLLHGETPEDWRKYVVSEYDYSFQEAKVELETKPLDAWMRMIFDGRYKYILAEGFCPLLFDLQEDPQELMDRGNDPELADERARLHELLFEWARRPRQRNTVPDGIIEIASVQRRITEGGILIGFVDEEDILEKRSDWRPLRSSSNPVLKHVIGGQHNFKGEKP